MSIQLSLRKVNKEYKKKQVLNNIDMKFESGRIYGIVGPNGVGKTTIIRIISGLITEYNGNLEYICNGDNGNIQEFRKKAGFIIEEPNLDKSMTAADNLYLNAILAGTEKDLDYDAILRKVGLEKDKKKVGKFSLGMRQRLGIACLLVNDPDALFLDEPMNGLDPVGVKEFRKLMQDMAHEDNKLIVITSHMLSELQKLCDEYYFIKDGMVVRHIEDSSEIEDLEDEYMNIMVYQNE